MKKIVCLILILAGMPVLFAFADIAPNSNRINRNSNALGNGNRWVNSAAVTYQTPPPEQISNRNAASNIARRPHGDARLQISIDPKLDKTTLVVTRQFLAELNSLADSTGTVSGTSNFMSIDRLPTVIAGFLLTLALTTGGLVILRSRKHPVSLVGLGVVGLMIVGSAVTAVLGDAAAPRPGLEDFSSRTLSLEVRREGKASGYAQVEIGDRYPSGLTVPSEVFRINPPNPDIELKVPVDPRDKRSRQKNDEEEE